jgi:hypothetical protein
LSNNNTEGAKHQQEELGKNARRPKQQQQYKKSRPRTTIM